MATFTASEVNALRSIHAGLNVVRSRFTGSATVSEVVLLAKIPNKATVIDWKLSGGLTGATTGTWKIGFQGTVVDTVRNLTLTDDSIHPGASLTSSGVCGANLANWSVSASIMVASRAAMVTPFRISLSDDAANQWAWMQGLFTAGSQTGTHSLDFIVTYIVGDGS